MIRCFHCLLDDKRCSTRYLFVCQVDLLVAGFPCISLSPLTSTPGSIQDESCSSGHGFESIKRYIKRHKPEVVLLENVQTLFHCRRQEGGQTPSLSFEVKFWCSICLSC